MSDIAIRVENLSKRYRIGALQRHETLRDAPFALAALVPWQYFSGSLSRVGTSLVNSSHLISKGFGLWLAALNVKSGT